MNDGPTPHLCSTFAVVRDGEPFVPTGDFRFEEGDRALIFTLTETLPALERMFRGR